MDYETLLKLLADGQHGQSVLFYKLYPHNYVITSMKGKEGYYYDDKKKLWVELSESLLLNHLSEKLNEAINFCIEEYQHLLRNCDDDDICAKIKKKDQ
jgi:hypothetical protein